MMRHILLTFGISLLLSAMALPTQAQVVNGHVTFLGIPLNETPQGMRDKLMAKGMKKAVGMETDTGNIYLTGTVNGVPSTVHIVVGVGNKIYNINCIEKKDYRLPQAKARAKALLAQMEAIYGKAKSTNFSDDVVGEATINVANGSVLVGYSNQDEMDGASDFYYVSSTYNDQRDN
jgi:hypothetical protein